METDEGESDVLPRPGVGEDPGSGVLDILDLLQATAGGPEQDSTAVVKTGGDEGVEDHP